MIRVAICQIESHPAVTVADHNLLCEPLPYLPNEQSLSSLSRSIERLASLRDRCRADYVTWQRARINAILRFLGSLDPVPGLVVFPEASVPLEVLEDVFTFSASKGVCVVAGTHSLSLGRSARRLYTRLSVSEKTLRRWQREPGGTALLPIVTPDGVEFRLKAAPSIFEQTEVSRPASAAVQHSAIRITVGGANIDVVPLVCSEALQLPGLPSRFDLVVICALTEDATVFDPVIGTMVGNRKPVLLANDGRFGGSGLHLPIDRRVMPWWWGDDINGRMPVGDGIIVADIDLANLAPQVGVTNPTNPVTLIGLPSVCYEDSGREDFEALSALPKIQESNDPVVQERLVGEVMAKVGIALPRLKLPFLARLIREGTADPRYWSLLANDCCVPALSDIRGKERELAEAAAEALLQVLKSGAPAEVLGRVAAAYSAYQKAAPAVESDQVAQRRGVANWVPVNRGDEIASLRTFLGNPRRVLACVSGLPSSGKSVVIDAAFGQAGYVDVPSVVLPDDVTPEFLCMSVLSALGHPRARHLKEIVGRFGALFEERLREGALLILQSAQNMTARREWRDPAFPALLRAMVERARKRGAKVLLESATEVDVQASDPNLCEHLHIAGMETDNALVFLDQQLRRAGLVPDHYPRDQRQQAARALGGHPGAIVLATEQIAKRGLKEVLEDLSKRRGVHSEIVKRLVRGYALTDGESRILGLLSLARRPIPISVLVGVTPLDVGPVVGDLLRLGLVERAEQDHIVVSPVVAGSEEFSVPTGPEQEAFHRAAATAFTELFLSGATSRELAWGVEARFHAFQGNVPALAPDIGGAVDGLLGAVRRMVADQDYERAKPYVERLIKDRKSAETLELGALVFAHIGDCDGALTLARETLVMQPERSWVVTEVGRLAMHAHRIEVAEDCVKIAKAAGADSPFIANLEGKIWLKRERPDKAIEAFRRGVESSRYDAWSHFYLGRTLIRQGDLPEAIEVLHAGDEVETGRWHPRRSVLVAIRTQLALAYLYSGDHEEAERWLGLAVEDDVGNPEVARALAFMEASRGDKDVAERALARLDPSLARDRSRRAQIHLFRALFLLGLGRREEASKEFSLASEKEPRNVYVLLRWSETLIGLAKDASSEGDKESSNLYALRAKDVAQKVLEFDKDNAKAMRLLERIADEFNVL